MTAKCAICRRPVNGAMICVGCERAFDRTVAEIPALNDELETTITRQSALGSRNGSRATETPVAFNVRASTVAEELRATLAGWCRDLDGPTVNTAQMGRFLLWRLPEIRQHPSVDQLVDEVTYACRQGWRAVDRPKDRSKVFISECLEVSCVGELWVRIPTDAYVEDDPSTHALITCTECQIAFPTIQWMSVGKRVRALEAAS